MDSWIFISSPKRFRMDDWLAVNQYIEFVQNNNVQVGDKLPYGKFNTLSIISVRNMILTDPGVNPNYVAVPQVMMNGGNEVLAEYTVLESRMKTTYDYYATYENHHNMIVLY